MNPSRPAATESPLVERLRDVVSRMDSRDWYAATVLMSEAATAIDLAQTEIKGLTVQIARLGKDLACAQENFHVTNQAYVKDDAERTQAQARIAALEKAIQRIIETDDFDDLELDDGLWANSARRFLQAALKDRA